ncbi:MAG: hypothetical protein ACOCNE_00295 [Prevotella pectinovora]
MIDGIREFEKLVPEVNDKNNYWLVRTMGGQYFKDFIDKRFIAIGYNEITSSTIRGLDEDIKVARRVLKEIYRGIKPDAKAPGQVANQLIRFYREIKVGDIVLVPGMNSFRIAICKVVGDVYDEVTARDDNGQCPFVKRLPVELLKIVSRRELPPKAQFMFNSRHPISLINDYCRYVDGSVSDFYNKAEETHIVLNIRTDDDVDASAFFHLQSLLKITEEYCREQGIEGKSSEVSMKVQMESKGMLHLSSKNKTFITVFAIFILGINGGGLKIDCGDFQLDLSTNGFFKNYSEYLDRKVDRDTRVSIKNALDTMKISTPEDFQKAALELYQKQNEARDKY